MSRQRNARTSPRLIPVAAANISEGLGQKVNCTCFHRSHGHGDVTVAGGTRLWVESDFYADRLNEFL